MGRLGKQRQTRSQARRLFKHLVTEAKSSAQAVILGSNPICFRLNFAACPKYTPQAFPALVNNRLAVALANKFIISKKDNRMARTGV